jgi:hypothetical protein
VTHVGFKPMLVTGMLFGAAGLAWFSRMDTTGGTYVSDVLGPMAITAIGIGLSAVPATIAAVSGSEHHEAGLASGLLNTPADRRGARPRDPDLRRPRDDQRRGRRR